MFFLGAVTLHDLQVLKWFSLKRLLLADLKKFPLKFKKSFYERLKNSLSGNTEEAFSGSLEQNKKKRKMCWLTREFICKL